MNKFIFSAIAIAAASSTSFANGSDWLQLDQDIASLSTAVSTADGATVGGLLRNSYRDHDADGGWSFEDADIWIQATLEEFGLRVSFDLATGSLVLEDAYVSWACSDTGLDFTWGQFRAQTLRSANIDPENMLFIDRSELGSGFDRFDAGVEVAGSTSGVAWAFALQNGDDSLGEELLVTAHASYNIGNGVGMKEGAMNAGDEVDGVISLCYIDMQEASYDAVLMLDAAFTMGPFSASCEFADGDDDTLTSGHLSSSGLGEAPSAIAVGYLLNDNMEFAFRHQDLDNAADDSIDTFGFNYYMHGHNAKFAVNYIDDEGATDEVIAINLTVGSSR